ncbi:unnamed protein product [Orchesella dallaii]|uniref:Methyl farnesoate epoxidase n=1 Tax=Orchesella dallaii TaxID=48710 RepID=A0ABP1RA07_9HEXA
MEIFSVFSTPLLVVLVIFLISKLFKRRPKNLPPGPLPLPFIGNLLQLAWINPTEPYRAFAKMSEKYGNIMSIQLGSVYAVVFNSFEVMEEYLVKPEFSDRFYNDWMQERTFQKQLGIIFSHYLSPWQELRRFSLRTLRDFGFGKRNKMHPIIQAELEEVMTNIKTKIKEDNGIITFDGYFSISTLNLMWSMLAGARYEHSDPKLLKLTQVIKDFLASNNVTTNVLFAFPEWRHWFPDLTGMTAQRKCFKETNDFFQGIVNERKQLEAYKSMPENLIDEFLHEIELQEKEKGKGNESIFTEEQLVALVNDFFLAGAETTASTTAWCLLFLLTNPEVQKKLQEEIDRVVPNGTFLTEEHEPLLHYTRATLSETLRMGDVLPLMVPRSATEDTTCGGFFIPKGTYIMANTHKINHDKDYWKDPETFRPERFIDDNGHFKSDPRLKPFGFGKRACLGERLASMSLLHYLTALMQNFTFLAVPNESPPSIEPLVGLTNGPHTYRALVECRF